MISDDLATFLSGGIDMHLGTRDAELRPHGVRVVALSVDDDRAHVLAYVPAVGADAVLHDLNANGQAALVGTRAPDDVAYQLKGTFAGARPADDGERAYVQAFWKSGLDSLSVIGIPHTAFGHWPVWPCIVIRVRVTAVFSQTPGPGAGAQVPR